MPEAPACDEKRATYCAIVRKSYKLTTCNIVFSFEGKVIFAPELYDIGYREKSVSILFIHSRSFTLSFTVLKTKISSHLLQINKVLAWLQK